MPKQNDDEQADNRDIFDIVGDYLTPVGGAALGAVTGRKIFRKMKPKYVLKSLPHNDTLVFTVSKDGTSDFGRGIVSNESPLGRTLIGKKKGSVFSIQTPGGRRVYKVIKSQREDEIYNKLRHVGIGAAVTGGATIGNAVDSRNKK